MIVDFKEEKTPTSEGWLLSPQEKTKQKESKSRLIADSQPG